MEDVFRSLHDRRLGPDDIPGNPDPGVYAIFAVSPDCLPGIVLPQSSLVYIGQSGDLAKRNHFGIAHSGFSSPRRSLGALLRQVLRLRAEPRSPGPSTRNYKNYRFVGDGEARLTEWMRNNLTCAIYPLDGNTTTLEKILIRENAPPLNLTGWRNPQKAHIQALRKICKDEASLIHWERHRAKPS